MEMPAGLRRHSTGSLYFKNMQRSAVSLTDTLIIPLCVKKPEMGVSCIIPVVMYKYSCIIKKSGEPAVWPPGPIVSNNP